MTSPSTSTPSRAETRFALALLCLVLVVNAVALSAETWASRTPGNDNVSHLSLISGMVSAIEHHLNPLDFWSPEASFGSAPIRTYQPLAHLLVTAVYFAFGKAIPLSTVFAWFAYLAIVLLPAAFFAAARLLELPPLTAAAAALLAPLLSTNASYGLDYSSYVTTGRGLFPQSVATLLLLLALGYGFRALRHGTHGILAGLLLGLTCVCHFIYGWIGAVTLLLLLTVATPGMAHALRIRRLVTIGATAFLIAVFQLMPVFADGPILNHSRWEPAWKWDSFGAGAVLKALFSGEVLDYDRLPLLSLLALAGTLLVAWNFYRTRHLSATEWFVAAGALLWLLLYCGRPTWGRLLDLLGVTADFHLHRLIGAVQIFLVLLAAIALAAAWRSLASRGWAVAALLGTIVILAPMLVERSRYLAIDESSATLVRIAVDGDRPVIDATISELTRTGGRTYAGSGLSWGARFQTANIPFFAFLYLAHVPQASVSYHPAALTFDLLPVFDERNPAHYRLFNVRSVVAPAALTGQMAGFLRPRVDIGHNRIFDAPGTGYFEIVDAAAAVTIDKRSFYDVNRRWLLSDWVERRTHLWLDLNGEAPAALPRLAPDAALPAAPTAPPAGEVTAQSQIDDAYRAEFALSRPAFVLFRMTWHPNWVAMVDGQPVKTAMLSPGFIGVPTGAGRHAIELRYQPGPWKWVLALAGLALVLLALALERRGHLALLGFARTPTGH